MGSEAAGERAQRASGEGARGAKIEERNDDELEMDCGSSIDGNMELRVFPAQNECAAPRVIVNNEDRAEWRLLKAIFKRESSEDKSEKAA